MEIFILRDGQQTGPFNEDTVQSLFQRGSLTSADMAWRKGLPAWTPLGEVLHPGSERPSAPPPVVQSGIRQAPGKKSASDKQKALLKYIGATFAEEITREEAALMISDAMENPKLTSRLQKWTEEKLKLHPDLFQEELDQRRSHRVLRYLERCQTEASEAVKDVTKAHVQVLVESLDKRTATWEHDPKAALWDHLLPAIAEHFPQLVRDGWKGKLKAGGGSKVADAMVESGELTEGPEAPSAMMAVVRGLVFGGLALALFFGIRHLTTTETGKSGTPGAGQNSKTTTSTPADANAAAGAPNGNAPTHPTNAPLIAANQADNVPAPTPNAEANAAVPDANAAPAAPANPPAAPAPADTPAPAPAANVPAADPNMAASNPPAAPAPGVPANPAMALGTPPAPAPPGTEAPAVPPTNVPPAPVETPAAAAGFKNILSIIKPVKVQLQFGVVTLNVGTRVRFIALEGQNVRVNFNNNIILVPAIATDVDPSAIPPAPVVAPPPVAPAAPAPAPAAATAPKPAVPAAPKPSSDL